MREAEEYQEAVHRKEAEMQQQAAERARLSEELAEAKRRQEEASAELIKLSQQPRELFYAENDEEEDHPNGSARIDIEMCECCKEIRYHCCVCRHRH
ncbi:PREDICTED: moesin/ezrin/radixin homolog 1-like [Priapulus caudatus]|uniref:Moesin/ezrin/radixin homolog 1-like n=1 Tax=Priapulus caudatus TaxID=37621 RepID=A0ABM1F1V1_PRICU|nr:PREDICTED: moesin/ezrin/radixin homolog 1-like [Priapulus caudatus]